MPTRVLARRALRLAGRRLVAEARPRADALRGVRVDPHWQWADEDGVAARLSPTQTIEVTRKGRWRRHDPLRVEPGWWDASRQVLGLGLWSTVVGAAWWLGRRHGRGPLRLLQDPWPTSLRHEDPWPLLDGAGDEWDSSPVGRRVDRRD